MEFRSEQDQSRAELYSGQSNLSLPLPHATKSSKRKMRDAVNNKRCKTISVDENISVSQKNQRKYVIHNCLKLTNKKLNLDESLQVLLGSYLEAPYTFSDEGFLPIHLACIYYPTNVKIVDMIMKANPGGILEPSKFPVLHSSIRTITAHHSNSEKYYGTFPLHMAVINGASLDVIKLLTFQDPKTLIKKDKHGNTPLSIAIKYNANVEVFDFLLAQNNTVSFVSDNKMNTPLHIACMYNHCKDVIEALLLSVPAALNIKNRDGLKPLDLAMRSSNCPDNIINLLAETSFIVENKLNDIDVWK